MKAIQSLPGGYSKIYSVNMQKDTKTAIFINVLAWTAG